MERTMTRPWASLRARSLIWLTPALLMACLPPRPTLNVPDGGIDAGPGAMDGGAGKADGKPVGTGGATGSGGALGSGGAAGVDAGGCVAGAHLCGGQCVSNTDVAHCAQSCSPCPVPLG